MNMAVKEKTWDCIHSWLIVGEIDSVGQQVKGSSFIFFHGSVFFESLGSLLSFQ